MSVEFLGGPRTGAGGQPLPFSPAVRAGPFVFVSGQVAMGDNGEIVPGGIEAQTRQALANAEAILLAAGSRRERVLKATLYISDIALWAQVNAEYAAFFGDHKPARAIVPVGKFRNGFLIEIEMVAALLD